MAELYSPTTRGQGSDHLKKLDSGPQPLAPPGGELRKNHQRSSNELIHESVMRGGGVPFGRPYARGLLSLTERLVRRFKLRGFFGFDDVEPPAPSRNKFTQYGAAPYTGPYRRSPSTETPSGRGRKS